MKDEGSVAAHSETLRALNLQPPKIRSHLDLLSDPLAALRGPVTPAPAQPRLTHTRSLRGVFQSRLNGPLGSLQAPASQGSPTPASAARSPRALKRLVHTRPQRARSQPASGKENLASFEEDEDEGFEDVWAYNGREEPRPMLTRRNTEAADTRWAGDLTRLSSALDQLAALCNATQRPQNALESGGVTQVGAPHAHNHGSSHSSLHPLPVNVSPSCPVHGTNALLAHTLLAAQPSLEGGRASPKAIHQHPFESDSGGSSGGHVVSTPPSPVGGSGSRESTTGMAKRMGVALRALGGRLVAWGKGGEVSHSNTQLSSSSSSSSSPVTGRHAGHPTPSPTPPNGPRTDMMPHRKVVVALYDYDATEVGDMSLRKDDELEVLNDAQEHWWKMRNIDTGLEGFAPSNYVRDQGSSGLQQYEWYLGDATRQRAEVLLMKQEREGGFVVRNSTTNSGIYTLSVFSKHLPRSRPQVKHYHIKKDQEGNYFLSHHIKCPTIPELIYKHQLNPGGLCTRLRPILQGKEAPTTAGLGHDKWEIDPNQLNLMEELGSGQFGVVRHGKFGSMHVAVKMMKEGTMSEDEFIEEAKVMRQLRHQNLVQLYGVCSKRRPIYIVTEYLCHGSLLNYLRENERTLLNNTAVLDMCLQVCSGMEYLEKKKFIHRDLAARNCLVGANSVIKVGDFGLARYVVDDEYNSSGGAKFPIKWAAPEVLNFMRFSSKSDVWAFGVLMWEVYTCGKMPYGRMRNPEVVERVQSGCILEQPRYCPEYVYGIMRQCWTQVAEARPSFSEILIRIMNYADD